MNAITEAHAITEAQLCGFEYLTTTWDVESQTEHRILHFKCNDPIFQSITAKFDGEIWTCTVFGDGYRYVESSRKLLQSIEACCEKHIREFAKY